MKKFNQHYVIGAAVLMLLIFLFSFIKYTANNANEKSSHSSGEVTGKNNSQELSSDKSVFSEESVSDNETFNVSEDSSDYKEETTSSIPVTTSSKINYKKLIDFDAEFPYLIKVNRAQNWTMVYGLDKKGRYSVPYKIFVCSVGLNEGDTPTGTFHISDKYDWRLMVDNSYAQYAIRIYGQIMLHSVPYYSPHKDDLEVAEYNKLGSPSSLGCIRFNVESIKWIYDNCPVGTTVIVYDSEIEEPLLKLPKLKKAKSTGEKAGWDPTDPDKNNPWKKKSK